MEHTETKTTSSQYGDFYEKRKMAFVEMEEEIADLLKYVDDTKTTFVDHLEKVVSIPSVSGVFKHRDDVTAMISFTEDWLKKLKFKYECFDIGWHKIDGLCCKLPVVIMGTLGKSKQKKTICIYSHLDVTSPEGETWDTDPFTLTEKQTILFGKGTALGKGALISWFHAIEAYQKHKVPLPVNIKFIIESMNAQGNEGLEELLKKVKPTFLQNIDTVVLCASEWLAQKYPCMVYGCAGSCRFEITVEQNKESNPKEDMETIFSGLVNEDNRILIPNYYNNIDQISPAEERLYDAIDFNFQEIRAAAIGNLYNPHILRQTLPPNKQHWDKVQMLMNFWRLPDIAVGEDEVCNCEKNDTTTLKRCFTMKIVPKQTPDSVAEQVINHIYKTCQVMKCNSKVTCEMVSAARPWLEDYKNPSYEALRRATIQVYHEDPNLIREDREIPVLLLLLRAIEADTLLLAVANGGSFVRGGNESIAKRNYIEGTKLLIAFLKQYSLVG